MSKDWSALAGNYTFCKGRCAKICRLMIEPNSIIIEFLKRKAMRMFVSTTLFVVATVLPLASSLSWSSP